MAGMEGRIYAAIDGKENIKVSTDWRQVVYGRFRIRGIIICHMCNNTRRLIIYLNMGL